MTALVAGALEENWSFSVHAIRACIGLSQFYARGWVRRRWDRVDRLELGESMISGNGMRPVPDLHIS